MRNNLYNLVLFSKRYSKGHIAICRQKKPYFLCRKDHGFFAADVQQFFEQPIFMIFIPAEQVEQRLGKRGISAARFQWKRKSADSTTDAIWNNAHTGMKSILRTARDLLFSATYDCEHLKED